MDRCDVNGPRDESGPPDGRRLLVCGGSAAHVLKAVAAWARPLGHPPRTRSRTTSLIFRLAIVVVLLGTVAAGPIATGAAEPAVEIAWRPCATPTLPTRECGELTVPLDYDEPEGATISVAVARVPAPDPTARIGSLLLNPGGPGGAGVAALPLMYAALPAELFARFDLVSFDPRGVGQSAPVRCFATIAERTAFFDAIPSIPADASEAAARQGAAEELAQRCAERNGQLLSHLSTANVARDLDRLRQAVGDDRITYLGASYGTYLGATYANLFPDLVRAMVLDGVIDPPSYTNADHGVGNVAGPDTTAFLRILSNEGSADALAAFFAECAAAGPERCAFAAETATATRQKFDALMVRLRAEPMIVHGPAGTLTVTYSLALETVRGALYAAPLWSGLAQGLHHLDAGDAAGFLVATGSLGGPPPTEYVNSQEATPASNCVDADNPADPAQFQEMARRAEERTPYFGAIWAYLAQPCVFWTATDADRYVGPWDAATSAPILLISRVYDPATPHLSAIAASRSLANARLLTIAGWGHSYFEGGRSTCANDLMAAYLIDLELPPPGTVCPEDEPPFRASAADDPGPATPIPAEIAP